MDFFKAVEERRSIRKFKSNPITPEKLKRILEAGRLAPSGSNRQPWSFIVVRNLETKKALATASDDQQFIAAADTIVVALGDPSVYPRSKTSSTRIIHKQDPMIAVEHMVLASTALGYGTCWIGAFNEDEVKRNLKIPENMVVIALLPIGVPDENPSPRPRKAFREIFFEESYGKPMEM